MKMLEGRWKDGGQLRSQIDVVLDSDGCDPGGPHDQLGPVCVRKVHSGHRNIRVLECKPGEGKKMIKIIPRRINYHRLMQKYTKIDELAKLAK
jgi:hypothetical protein